MEPGLGLDHRGGIVEGYPQHAERLRQRDEPGVWRAGQRDRHETAVLAAPGRGVRDVERLADGADRGLERRPGIGEGVANRRAAERPQLPDEPEHREVLLE